MKNADTSRPSPRANRSPRARTSRGASVTARPKVARRGADRWTRAVWALALAVAAAVAPSAAEAQAMRGQVYAQPSYGQPVAQPGYPRLAPARGYAQPQRTEERAHVGLIAGGAAVFGASWLLHALLISPLAGCGVGPGAHCSSDWETFRWTGAIPVVGPWVQLGLKPSRLGQDGWAPYLIIDGVLQAGGLAMLIAGATVRESVVVYGDARRGPSLSVGVRPGGITLDGTF